LNHPDVELDPAVIGYISGIPRVGSGVAFLEIRQPVKIDVVAAVGGIEGVDMVLVFPGMLYSQHPLPSLLL